jgi:hypothetical protein
LSSASLHIVLLRESTTCLDKRVWLVSR